MKMNRIKTIWKTASTMRGSSTQSKSEQIVIDVSDMETDNITEEIEKTLREFESPPKSQRPT